MYLTSDREMVQGAARVKRQDISDLQRNVGVHNNEIQYAVLQTNNAGVHT